MTKVNEKMGVIMFAHPDREPTLEEKVQMLEKATDKMLDVIFNMHQQRELNIQRHKEIRDTFISLKIEIGKSNLRIARIEKFLSENMDYKPLV